MTKIRKKPMAKRQFRIGELAKALNVENYVVRFWEKEFDLNGTRSTGGQRFYTTDDLNLFSTIKELLYTQGFTIAGARKQLAAADNRRRSFTPAVSEKNSEKAIEAYREKEAMLTQQLVVLKGELQKLKAKLA